MKKLFILVLIVAIATLIISVLPIHGEEKIYDSVVRLHVLANSDEDHDQALKLKVRDRLLEITSPIVVDCTSRDEAREKLTAHFSQLEAAAREVILSEGYSYDVKITLEDEYYPTRKYENLCFPEGTYASLKVEIGEAEGKNWWCVLFPPLCLSAASEKKNQSAEDAFIAVGLTDEQYKVITETDDVKYKARFKILEVFQKWF